MSLNSDSKMVKKRHLVRRIKRSDTEAFRELFEIYQRNIFNFLHFKLGNIEAAEDLLQDVFIKIWERRCQLRENISIRSFLFHHCKTRGFKPSSSQPDRIEISSGADKQSLSRTS